MDKIINTTSKNINILDNNNNIIESFKPSEDFIVQINKKIRYVGSLNNIPIIETLSEVIGLPKYDQIDVWYIVDDNIKSISPDRKQWLIPSNEVKDINGNIIGYRSLSQ